MKFAILCNCNPLLFSIACSPLALSPHHPLCSSLCSAHLHLCQPFLPSNFYRLTNAVRWSWLACTLHKQPACSHHSHLTTPQLHCHTCLHEIKQTLQCQTSNSHTYIGETTHTRSQTAHKQMSCLNMENPSVGFATIQQAVLVKAS